jgi:hypothetical protein
MQPRQRACEIGNAGESELIEGDSGHVDLGISYLGITQDHSTPLTN